MSQSVTLAVVKATAPDTAQASRTVDQYRANGGGSNRTNWTQVTAVLCAVLCAIRTGKAVEVTDLYQSAIGGKSPAYNMAHRQLSAGVIRPLWHKVQVVALTGATGGKGTVTGTPNTTVPMGAGVRLFVVPVA